jgi:peptidoglycan/LPS O-acetylase OafA/YrhL
MASSSSRSRAATRRSARPAPRGRDAAEPAGERPLAVTLAAVFGLLVAAVDAYLTWLLWTPEVGWDSYLLVPILLGVLAVAAAVAVFLGLRRAWLLLVVAAVLPLVGMLAVVVLFAALGGGSALWGALALLIAPVGCLVLALRRPVREWTGRALAGRPPGGRRGTGSDR